MSYRWSSRLVQKQAHMRTKVAGNNQNKRSASPSRVDARDRSPNPYTCISSPIPLSPKGIGIYDSIFVGVSTPATRLAEVSGGGHTDAAEWARPASQHARVTVVRETGKRAQAQVKATCIMLARGKGRGDICRVFLDVFA